MKKIEKKILARTKSWIDELEEVSDYESEEESDLDSGCEIESDSEFDQNETKNQTNSSE